MRFEDGAIACDRFSQQRIAPEDRCRGVDLLLQFPRQRRRDQAPEAFGRAQAQQATQLRDHPIAGTAGAGRDGSRRQHADTRAMGEGSVDELRQIDPGNTDNENAETGHRDGER